MTFTFRVYYCNHPGFETSEGEEPHFTRWPHSTEYQYMGEFEAETLEVLFYQMQGEIVSEAFVKRVVKQADALGWGHTSMSVGDVAIDKNNQVWQCLNRGWGRLLYARFESFETTRQNAPEETVKDA